jgi:hypothetical protein
MLGWSMFLEDLSRAFTLILCALVFSQGGEGSTLWEDSACACDVLCFILQQLQRLVYGRWDAERGMYMICICI